MLDEVSFKEVYDSLAGKLTNWLAANGSDYAAACDIVQETFARVWQKKETFSDKDCLSGFVFSVAKNLQTDYFRKNRRLEFKDEITETDGGMCDPTQKIGEKDLNYLRKRLQHELSKLPEDMRQAYTLFQIANLSVRQIAAITKASESSVKVRVHRAKEKLQTALADLKGF